MVILFYVNCSTAINFSITISITDETEHGGKCTQAADSCTYPNAKCLGDGTCGCLDGLTFINEGCCKLLCLLKYRMIYFEAYLSVWDVNSKTVIFDPHW